MSIKCSNCSFANAPDSKFCENCGQPFERACPNCNKPVSSNAKFCRNCGFNLAAASDTIQARLADLEKTTPPQLQKKILTRREETEGERKLVTVLFADIVGSTALAEKLDPEDWGGIVSGAHRCVTQAIFRYEGTIAQLLGDGVLAFFGAPIAHEDDPVRAVNAALDILASIGDYARELAAKKQVESFQMRVGLNTGLVVVGNIGSDLHVEYLAVGDTVNLAARMQSAADPNTILVSQNTARWAKHAFNLESKGEIEIKGKTKPVPVFRVVGRKAIPESARGIEGLNSPLVGRERELKMLKACMDELSKGKGQLVSVMGEAGLGKSRLVAELRKWVAAERPLQWNEGRALSYQTTTPYAPLIDLFTKLFGLQPEETDAEKYDSVKAGIERIVGRDAQGNAPLLATLLGIKFEGEDLERVKYLEPPQLRERIFAAVVNFFEQMASKQPLVLVFEDLHWADSNSLELIARLYALTDRAPVMILALFRPQTQEAHWQLHETAQRDYAHRYTTIALEPLDESSARQLVGNLLEIEDLPDKVRALILKKAEGNPFFVEEVIRSLLDAQLVVRVNSHWRATREIESIQLPDTLAGVISARLDRLDDHSKKVAQAAAVIGREFQYDILSDVYDGKDQLQASLTSLQRRELVREKSRLPSLLYLFKHALTQETAYASLLLSKRRELHKRIADCLEQIEPDRVNEIALHYLKAEDQVTALPYLVQSGERAAHAYSTPEAIGYFTQSIEIIRNVNDPALARRAYEGLGGALTLTNDMPRAVDHYGRMLKFGEEHRDIPMQVSAHNKLGMILGQFMGQLDPAEEHLLTAEKLAQDYKDRAGLAELYTVRCGNCTIVGDFANAAHYLAESVQIGRELDMKDPIAFGLAHTANTYTFMARFDDAWEKAQEALKFSEEVGNQLRIAEVYVAPIPFYYLHRGDLDAARAAAAKGVEIAQRIGAMFDQSVGTAVQAEIARMRGEYESAIELFGRAEKLGAASGYPFMVAYVPAALGEIYAEISDQFAEKAKGFQNQALQAMQNPTVVAGAASAFADIGFCALMSGDLIKAEEQFNAGLARPTIHGLLVKPFYLMGKAFVALGRHNPEDAIKFARDARTYIEEKGMKYLLASIELVDAQVSAARGDMPDSLRHYASAESHASRMKMRAMNLQARIGASKVLAAMTRKNEADEKKRQAQALIDEIANLFEDQGLRQAFVASSHAKLIIES